MGVERRRTPEEGRTLMAQPNEAAGDVGNPADSSPADAFEAIAAEMLGEQEEEQPEEGEEPEGEQSEGDEADVTEDDLEAEAEEEELPPIDAPVSWTAEEKERFAGLPRETQEYIAKRETERERFVQSKAQEAARAKQETEQAALSQLAEIERGYSQQFQSLAEQLQPQRPNPALLQHDPQAFYALQADYESKVAQQRELQQQAQVYAQQAEQREAQAANAERAQQIQILSEHFPEYLDPTTGPEQQRALSAVAKELGYPDELITQARAADIIAMKKVADLKAKAAKYDALQAKKMEKVRAAKGLPRAVKPGVAVSSDQTRTVRKDAAFERAKNSNGQARVEAFDEYLRSAGII
jgi:hypothetical protein